MTRAMLTEAGPATRDLGEAAGPLAEAWAAGAGAEDGSRPAQGGPEEEGAMIKSAHIHEFIADEREDWPGFNCRVCGFHIHANAESHARNAGARFIEDDGTLPLDEIPAGTECWCGHRAHLHDRHGCMFRNYNQDGGEGCSCVGFGTRH